MKEEIEGLKMLIESYENIIIERQVLFGRLMKITSERGEKIERLDEIIKYYEKRERINKEKERENK